MDKSILDCQSQIVLLDDELELLRQTDPNFEDPEIQDQLNITKEKLESQNVRLENLSQVQITEREEIKRKTDKRARARKEKDKKRNEEFTNNRYV